MALSRNTTIEYLCFGCQQTETEDSAIHSFWRQKHDRSHNKIEKHETETHSDSSNQTTNSFHQGYCSGCPGCCIRIPSAWLLILIGRFGLVGKGEKRSGLKFTQKLRNELLPAIHSLASNETNRGTTSLPASLTPLLRTW